MGKETYYFSHDYNARNDVKIKKLISRHGYNGYGIYWALIEDLYNNGNRIETDFELLTFDLRVEYSLVKSIVEDFNLFRVEDGFISSDSVAKRLSQRDERSQKSRDNAAKRWSNIDAKSRQKAENCIFYIIEMHKAEERFLKCGITSESISRRYSGKTNGYSYSVIYSLETSTIEGLEIEKLIGITAERYTPFDKFPGSLECFAIAEKERIIELAMQRECNGNAIKEKKGKERKGKEKKEEGMFSAPAEPTLPTPPSDEDVAFANFQKWLESEATEVSKMKEPFTMPQFLKLKKSCSTEEIMAQCVNMHNWKELNRKRTSAYYTFLNWHNRDGKK